MAAVSSALFSLGEWDTAQGELTDPTADGPRPVLNRAVCDAYATSFGASVLNAALPVSGLAIGSFCQPYYDDIGVGQPTLESPFPGGQCPVIYAVNYSRSVWSSSTPCQRFDATASVNILGPISGPTVESTPDANPSLRNDRIYFTDGNGQQVNVVNSGVNVACPVATISINSVTRLDGQPDNCGDQPGQFTPPPNYPTPRPVDAPTTVTIGGVDVDVTISDIKTDRKGDTYVTVEGPGFEVDFPVEGPTEVIRPPEVVTGSPIDVSGDSGRQSDDLSPEEQQDGFETIGYRFDLLGLPSNVSGIPGTDPRVLTTPYGNVQLEYRTDGGLILFSDNLPIRVVSGSIIRQDTNLKVEAIRYQKRPDVSSIRLTPVRARIV